MIRSIVRQSLAGAGAFQGSLSNFSLNGIVVAKSTPWHANDRLTASLMAPNIPTVTLVPNLDMMALAEISDHERGFSSGATQALNALADITFDYTGYAAYVDLGCLRNLENNSVLEVMVNSGDSGVWALSGVLHNVQDVDKVVRYIQSNQSQGTIPSCSHLFLYRASGEIDVPTIESLTVEVSNDYGSGVAQADDLFAATVVLGNREYVTGVRILQVFKDPLGGIPGAVSYQLTGTDASEWVVIGRVVGRDLGRVSRSTIGTARVVHKRLMNLDASERKAAERSGATPKLTDLTTALMQANIEGAR